MFYPDWKNGETSKEFNVSVFDFINQPGSLIDRKQVKSRKFPLTFWFQGENNIDQANSFDISAEDPRYWIVRHPFYGDIFGQPVSISRNDQNYNCTEITVDFWESIVTDFPDVEIDGSGESINRVDAYHVASPLDYGAKVDLKPQDASIMLTNVSKMDALIAKSMDAINYSEFQQLRVTMFNAVDDAIFAPVDAMSAIQAVLLIPSQLYTNVSYRIDLIKGIYGGFLDSLLLNNDPNTKAFFEAAAGYAVAALANTLLNPITSLYATRQEVINAATSLIDLYNNYLSAINTAYVSINNTTGAYSSSFNTQNTLQTVVFQSLVGLNQIAFSAKQERIVMVQTDTNLIVLTHKYMGLDPLDINIETFRKINNIKNNRLFLIPKGTQIKYYA